MGSRSSERPRPQKLASGEACRRTGALAAEGHICDSTVSNPPAACRHRPRTRLPRAASEPTAPARTNSRFFGWRMVGVAFVVEFIAVGFFFYSFGVFFKAIDAELAGSRLGVSLGMMVTGAVGGILAPFMGRALDRYPIKRIMLMGALVLSAALIYFIM